MTRERTRVCVVLDLGVHYHRQVLRGVADYARAFARWDVSHHLVALPVDESSPLQRADGVVLAALQRRVYRWLQRRRIPVAIAHTVSVPFLPGARPDEEAAGRLAAEHLLTLTRESYAWWGPGLGDPYRQRCRAFLRTLARAKAGRLWADPVSVRDRELRDLRLIAFERVADLPAGTAVYAFNDIRARALVQECRDAGRRVPQDVAVMGTDNDEVLCETSKPPLSSVDNNAQRVGFEACRVLARLMAGGRAGRPCVRVPPVRVVVRESTDLAVCGDRVVANAVEFMRREVARHLNTDDIAARVGVCRRLLETRFRKRLHTTPRHVLLGIRVDKAKVLLARTDLPISEVAAQTGLPSVPYLHAVFRKTVGMTPGAFRENARPGR